MKVAKDKILHFAVSMALAIALAPAIGPAASAMAVMGLGLAKEVFDELRPNGSGFDEFDWYADVVGVCLGYVVWSAGGLLS